MKWNPTAVERSFGHSPTGIPQPPPPPSPAPTDTQRKPFISATPSRARHKAPVLLPSARPRRWPSPLRRPPVPRHGHHRAARVFGGGSGRVCRRLRPKWHAAVDRRGGRPSVVPGGVGAGRGSTGLGRSRAPPHPTRTPQPLNDTDRS